MSLVLTALSLNEEPLSRPLIGRFDERGGQLGRSDNATFTLPDPERMISRVQAQITHRDDGYWIENVSAANPILHNGRPLSSGMNVALRAGDELRIGGYRMIAAFENDETAATILRGRTVTNKPVAAPPSAAPPAPVLEPVRMAAVPRPTDPPVAAEPPAAAGPERAAPAPRKASARPAVVRGRQPVPADAPASDGNVLWQGFVEGAGVELPLPHGPSPELLSAIGAMMKIAIEGIHHLLAMRAMAKSDMQAEMTRIQVRGNNPLKFSPDSAVALQLLLQPPARGFLGGPTALRDALNDLQSHQIGVMAGMHAALDAVLDRFDPVQLEEKLSARSVLDSLVPSHRRARLWELYLEHFRALREEAQEDFSRLFGEAFRKAYEAQIQSLEANAQAAPPAARPAEGSPR
jgi:FHA domain-containing protein